MLSILDNIFAYFGHFWVFGTKQDWQDFEGIISISSFSLQKTSKMSEKQQKWSILTKFFTFSQYNTSQISTIKMLIMQKKIEFWDEVKKDIYKKAKNP